MFGWIKSRRCRGHLGVLGWGLLLLSSSCRTSFAPQPSVEGPLSLGEELRIGLLISEKNWRSIYRSNQLIDASYLMRDRINACGGVNQAPISIVLAEAEATEESEVEAVRSLIEESRVHGIIAQLSSPDPNAALDHATQADIPLLIVKLGRWQSLIPTNVRSPHWGYITPSQQQKIKAFSQLIMNQGYSEVALITSDADDIESWQTAFIQHYQSLNGQITNADQPLIWKAASSDSEASSDENDSQLTNQLQQLLNQQPTPSEPPSQPPQSENTDSTDAAPSQLSETAQSAESSESNVVAIAIMADQQSGADLLETMVSMGWSSDERPVFWYDQDGLASMMDRMVPDKDVGADTLEAIAGIVGITPAANGEGLQEFDQAWDKRLEDSPTSNAANMWDAVGLFALAAQSSKQNSRMGISSALADVATPPGIAVTDICQGLEYLHTQESIDFQGASNSLDLSSNGETPGTFSVWELGSDGDIVVVDALTLDAQN
ncbi:MAG: ABC transporter substrate-binding protein [Leptolyngbyaceae bacterium]|nr:ABC transporter substrate-binding protein [Leptolyngbyaceae bacterium]